MSHHGYEPFDDGDYGKFQKMIADMKAGTESYRGPVGAYPDGKLGRSDEGSLQFAVGAKDGKVVIDFGSPVAWIGLTAQQTMDLAAVMMKRAREVARANGETVHVTIGG